MARLSAQLITEERDCMLEYSLFPTQTREGVVRTVYHHKLRPIAKRLLVPICILKRNSCVRRAMEDERLPLVRSHHFSPIHRSELLEEGPIDRNSDIVVVAVLLQLRFLRWRQPCVDPITIVCDGRPQYKRPYALVTACHIRSDESAETHANDTQSRSVHARLARQECQRSMCVTQHTFDSYIFEVPLTVTVATEAKANYGDALPAKQSRELGEHAPWTMATAGHAIKQGNSWICTGTFGHDEKAK